MLRRAARVDRNHGEIISALRACGCEVLDLSAVGSGCPDLLVLRAGRLYLVEVKDGSKPPSKRKLTPDQVSFHARWPVSVVSDVEQVPDIFRPHKSKTPGEGGSA